jgi:hypothetical protein
MDSDHAHRKIQRIDRVLQLFHSPPWAKTIATQARTAKRIKICQWKTLMWQKDFVLRSERTRSTATSKERTFCSESATTEPLPDTRAHRMLCPPRDSPGPGLLQSSGSLKHSSGELKPKHPFVRWSSSVCNPCIPGLLSTPRTHSTWCCL